MRLPAMHRIRICTYGPRLQGTLYCGKQLERTMTSYRIVVASNDRADFYQMPTLRGALEKTDSLTNPAARQRSRDLGTDAPGRVMNREGAVRHAYQPRHTLKERATEQFVRSVIDALAAKYPGRAGESLIFVAAPRLLGLYKRLMPRDLKARLAQEVRRDLAKSPKAVLKKHIQDALARP
jgi:protein required for attachment to host cells